MMVSLQKTCGLDVQLDSDKPSLIFGKGLNFSEPAVRTLSQMKEVLLDKNLNEPNELYYMYRDIHVITDQPLLEKNKLRYDITVIRPDCLGKEMMKTAGHYHPGSFGELYEVLYGHCFCLLQRPNAKDPAVIEEVIIVEASAGQKIVIPPKFGHILINPGPDYLITSNWVSSVFSSEYELYKKAGGAAYFVIEAGREPEAVANSYFKKNAQIRFVQPAKKIDKFGLKEAEPIYKIIHHDAAKLGFLNRPEDYDYSDVFIEAPLKIRIK